jgi:F420-0:gamma-glutamyl ligase
MLNELFADAGEFGVVITQTDWPPCRVGLVDIGISHPSMRCGVSMNADELDKFIKHLKKARKWLV